MNEPQMSPTKNPQVIQEMNNILENLSKIEGVSERLESSLSKILLPLMPKSAPLENMVTAGTPPTVLVPLASDLRDINNKLLSIWSYLNDMQKRIEV
jgi:hypothetical protein